MSGFQHQRQDHPLNHQELQQYQRGPVDESLDIDLDSKDSDLITQQLVKEAEHDTSATQLRYRIDSIIDLTRSASNLDLTYISSPSHNPLHLKNETIINLQSKLKHTTQCITTDAGGEKDAALGTDKWAFSLVPSSYSGESGLICLRNPQSNGAAIIANLRSVLQQCIEDHNVLNKHRLAQQLAVEIGRQAQNETLLDISAPGKSSRNLQQMGNADLDVNIFANAAEYLCRIIPAVQGCVIFDLSEFRMTVSSAHSRSQDSTSNPGEDGGSHSSSRRQHSHLKGSDAADSDAMSSTVETVSTSFSSQKKTSSQGKGTSTIAEQSVISEGGQTHCSYLPSLTPLRILGYSGLHRNHFDTLSGSISKPTIAQYLSMTRSSGLNSKTFIERVDASNQLKLHEIAPPNTKSYLCSSVAEADTQPAYLIYAFSNHEEVHFSQTEELFLEQLGAYLIYSSIRSRVVAVDRAQMRFTQRIQHELRTPLHAIIGVNEIAKQSLSHSFDLEEMSDLIQSIGASADSLSLLIDDMVDFSLMERLSGERKLMQTEVIYSDWESICSVVTSTCLHAYQISQRIRRLGHHTDGKFAPPPEMFVYLPDLYQFDWKEYKAQVDLEVVRRIIWKLVMNAIQATSKGIILVTIARKTSTEAIDVGSHTEKLEIEIADTGKGMEQKFVNERLFQPFGKEDEESQGVGLSLSICQALTSQMSGRLTAKSRLNQGTQMTISLPLKKTSKRGIQKASIDNTAKVAFIGCDGKDKRLFVNQFLIQFHLKESKDISRAPIVIISIDDPDLSHDCSKEIEILKSRVIKAKVVLLPTLILRELDEDRSTRLEALETTLEQEIKVMHRPLTVVEIQEFVKLIHTVQNEKEGGSNNGDIFEAVANDLQAVSLHSRLRSSSPNSHHPKFMEIPRRLSGASDTPSIDHPYCILVVEDNPLNARIMTTMLKKAGFDYMLASDGQQGVEAFRKHLPHLVLLDINMPVMDGFEACKAMRSVDSPYTHRIIAITALSLEVERRKGKESGMDDWLTKPTRMAPLLRDIRKWKQQYEGIETSNPSTPSSSGRPLLA